MADGRYSLSLCTQCLMDGPCAGIDNCRKLAAAFVELSAADRHAGALCTRLIFAGAIIFTSAAPLIPRSNQRRATMSRGLCDASYPPWCAQKTIRTPTAGAVAAMYCTAVYYWSLCSQSRQQMTVTLWPNRSKVGLQYSMGYRDLFLNEYRVLSASNQIKIKYDFNNG